MRIQNKGDDFPLTQNTSFDAFTMWKGLYEKTESTWRDSIQETLQKESFAEGLGQFQSQYLQYQELVNNMTASYLKQVNMPSREEIANVATLVINVESKLDDLEDQIDGNKENTTKEIEHLKRVVTTLDKKLDRVIQLLDNKSSGSATKTNNVQIPEVSPVPAISNAKK